MAPLLKVYNFFIYIHSHLRGPRFPQRVYVVYLDTNLNVNRPIRCNKQLMIIQARFKGNQSSESIGVGRSVFLSRSPKVWNALSEVICNHLLKYFGAFNALQDLRRQLLSSFCKALRHIFSRDISPKYTYIRPSTSNAILSSHAPLTSLPSHPSSHDNPYSSSRT